MTREEWGDLGADVRHKDNGEKSECEEMSDETNEGEKEQEPYPNRGRLYDIPKDVPGTPE